MFLVGVPFAIVAFVLCWLIPEVPLRDRAFVSVGLEGEGLTSAAPIPDEPAAQPAARLT
jgi:hypothetical protein